MAANESEKSPVDIMLRELYRTNRETLDPLMKAISDAPDDKERVRAIVAFSVACGRLAYEAGATDVILAVKNAVNAVKLPSTGA